MDLERQDRAFAESGGDSAHKVVEDLTRKVVVATHMQAPVLPVKLVAAVRAEYWADSVGLGWLPVQEAALG